MSNRVMFTTQPAALYVGCSPRTIQKWVVAGVLPLGVRPWGLFHRDDLDLAKARWKPHGKRTYKLPKRSSAGLIHQRA